MRVSTITASIILIFSLQAAAGIIRVPGEQTTIQAGINASSMADTILVADGSYSGIGNINLDFGGRLIVVMSENGPLNCTINCLGVGRGVTFHSGETTSSVFKGLTILCGNSIQGGAISITDSSPLIERCILASNSGEMGGGIYISSGNPHIINCTLVYNTATSGGAILLINSSPIITNCNIVYNNTCGT